MTKQKTRLVVAVLVLAAGQLVTLGLFLEFDAITWRLPVGWFLLGSGIWAGVLLAKMEIPDLSERAARVLRTALIIGPAGHMVIGGISFLVGEAPGGGRLAFFFGVLAGLWFLANIGFFILFAVFDRLTREHDRVE